MIVGAILVIAGVAVALNIAGVADRLARGAVSDRPRPHGDPSPESHFAMRMWGVALVFIGLLSVSLHLFF